MQTRYLLLVPHPSAEQLLVSHSETTVSLPSATRDDPYFWQNVEHVNALAHAQFGLHVTTRRCIAVQFDPVTQIQTKSYLLELSALPPLPPTGTRWLARDAALLQLPSTERAVVNAWLGWQRADDLRRVPWYGLGWMAQVRAWLTHQFGPLVVVEQLRSWQRSAIVLATVGQQRLFLKAVPPMFAHELSLSAWLAQQFPTVTPAVHTTLPERGWLLMHEMQGEPLDAHPNLERWAGALRQYAELQLNTVPHAASLKALGLPDRSGSWLCSGIDSLLADEQALLVGQPGGFSGDELARLRNRASTLHERCSQLLALEIPPALEHGDFGPWQVLADDKHATFLDWSDAALANPLFSLASFLMDLPVSLGSREAYASLVAAYLKPWEALLPRRRLEQAWALARDVSGLYGASVYRRAILPQMELRWEMERMLPYFARRLLSP